MAAELLPAADSEEDEEEEATAGEPPSPVLPPKERPASPPALQQPSCFFALLRDLFNETAEQKMSAAKASPLSYGVAMVAKVPADWCARVLVRG